MPNSTTALSAPEAGHWLLEVSPLTGRPHQIRVQLPDGLPHPGDIKYGDPEPNEDGSICLHAKQLSFEHPVKKVPLDGQSSVAWHGFMEIFFEIGFLIKLFAWYGLKDLDNDGTWEVHYKSLLS